MIYFLRIAKLMIYRFLGEENKIKWGKTGNGFFSWLRVKTGL